MTLLQAQDYVASLVDDLRKTYFTSDQLTIYLNQAAREAHKKLNAAGNNWYTVQTPDSGVGSYTTVVNQQGYTLPTGYQDIIRVELVQNPGVNETIYEVTPITLNQKGYFPPYSQTPAAFYIQENDLMLVPIPQSAAYTIRIWYTRPYTAASLVTDVMDVPEQFLEYVCYLAAIKCLIKDTRDPSLLKAEISDTEKRLEKAAIQRQKMRPRKVVVRDDFGFGGFYY